MRPPPRAQGDEVRLTTSWSLADGVLPPRCGTIGPPRDLVFGWSPTNGHGITGHATVATTYLDGMTAGIPMRGITKDMSQHGVGPTPGVHLQAWDGSVPQYQGTQMQQGAMLHGQLGIAQASQHQGFAGTAGFVTPGQAPNTQAHQSHGTEGGCRERMHQV